MAGAAFPEWQPADEKGDEAQLLPALRNGEITKLENPTIEDKETRPPPRYNEGTLIEAMQNAWRFVDDEVLRERLKDAKGIGTPATRAEIIGGLKKQGFLIAQGKNIVPTETGLALFEVLKQADPSLVDPGLTAQLECLLDEVVIGKQQMIGAIDAVCDVAQRTIDKLQEGAAAGGPPLLGAAIARRREITPTNAGDETLCRQHRSGERRQASARLCDIGVDLPRVPQSARAQESRRWNTWSVWLQACKSGTDVICREACTGERHRYSRRGQGHFGCHLGVDRLQSGQKA